MKSCDRTHTPFIIISQFGMYLSCVFPICKGQMNVLRCTWCQMNKFILDQFPLVFIVNVRNLGDNLGFAQYRLPYILTSIYFYS